MIHRFLFHITASTLFLFFFTLYASRFPLFAFADYLHAQGNHLVQNGQTIILQGMELSNFENSCNPQDPYANTDYDNLLNKWHVNEVKIPIQGKWWMGKQPFSRGFSCDATYHTNVYDAIDRALQYKFFVGIKMFHDDNGATMATNDELQAWQDITNHYKDDPRLFFELYNEPHDIATNLWRDGGSGFVGMSQLISAIRAIDSQRLLLIDVPGWSSSPGNYINPNDKTTWFNDTNLAYNGDVYIRSGNPTQLQGSNWPATFGNLAAVLPVIVGEYGSDDGSCSPLDGLLSYMHSQTSGYSAWTYDTGGTMCKRPRMIDTWAGDPNSYGQTMYSFYRAQTIIYANASGGTPIPSPTSAPNSTNTPTIIQKRPTPTITPLPTVSLGNITIGDINGDGVVDVLDFNILRSCFGIKARTNACLDFNFDRHDKIHPTLYSDINGDGIVSGIDYNIMIRNFGKTVSATSVTQLPNVTNIPPTPMVNNCIGCMPPMGWNNYNHFGNSITDSQVRQMADAMVSSGMATVGYQYINVDDSWETNSRDSNNNIIPNSQFPNGIKAVADYVHSKGLKFGIYTSPGNKTCNSTAHMGSGGFEQHDVTMFANWGVDYIKLDACGTAIDNNRLTLWKNAIKNSPNPNIYLSINAGTGNPGSFSQNYPPIQWRTGQDICDIWFNQQQNNSIGCFDSGQNHWGIKQYLTSNITQDLQYVKQGAYADPDMMEIGNGNLSNDEEKTHFSMWAMWSAPLIAGNDLTNMSAGSKAVLTNTEVIAIDKDAGGVHAMTKTTPSNFQVWKKILSDGSIAVAFVNLSDTSQAISDSWQNTMGKTPTKLHDLWLHQDISVSGNFSYTIPAHGTVLLRAS